MFSFVCGFSILLSTIPFTQRVVYADLFVWLTLPLIKKLCYNEMRQRTEYWEREEDG